MGCKFGFYDTMKAGGYRGVFLFYFLPLCFFNLVFEGLAVFYFKHCV